MLIVLPDVELPGESGLVATVLSNLARAEREGKHLLLVPRKFDQKLHGLDIREAERAQLKRAAQECTQRASLRGSVSRQIHVQWSTRGSFVAPEQGSAIQVWKVPATWFLDSSTCQAVHLAGENGDDIELLVALGQAWRDAQAPGSRMAFQARPMGGNNFLQLLDPLIQPELPFLAVVDSDRDGPDGALGATAKELKGAVKGLDLPHEARVLPARTMENMIPTALWRLAAAKDRDLQKAIQENEPKLSERGAPRTKLCDHGFHKNGLRLLHQALSSGRPEVRSATGEEMWSEHPLLADLAEAVAAWGLAAPPRRT